MVYDILECSEPAMENKINDIMDMYRKITKLKESYSQSIDNEMKKREQGTNSRFTLRKLRSEFDYLQSDFERINKFCEANIS